MRRAACLVMLAGCDIVLALEERAPAPDAAVDAVDAFDTTPEACLADSFDAAGVETLRRWRLLRESNEPVVVDQTAGQLRITMVSSAPQYNGIMSRGEYDMVGGSAVVEVVEVGREAGGVETAFQLIVDVALGYKMGVYENVMFLDEYRGSDRYSRVLSTFDPVADRWWRYRDAGSSIELETSPDRTTWTTKDSRPLLRAPTAVVVQLIGGTYDDGTPSPGTARFDNLAVISAGCPQ